MRVRCSLLSWRPEFLQCVGKNPDLWGPTWIANTIIFILFSFGNVSKFLVNENMEDYQYSFGYFGVAILIVYGMAFFVPLLMGLLLKYLLKSEVTIF